MTRNEFCDRYLITAARSGEVYDRPRLRAYCKRKIGRVLSLVGDPGRIDRALDNDKWMRSKYGQTPSAIVNDIWMDYLAGKEP